MRFHSSTVAIVASFLMFVAGCGGGADIDTLPQAMLKLLNDTTEVLKGITDEASAKSAEPKLKELAARKKQIDEQAKATKMSKADLDKSDEKYAGQIKEAADKMGAEVMRIQQNSPEAAMVVAEAMGF